MSKHPEGKTVDQQLHEILGREAAPIEVIIAFDYGTDALLDEQRKTALEAEVGRR